MAGQGINRREALRMAAMAAAASQFAIFERWAAAHEHASAPQKMSSEPYKPRFFSAAEFLSLTVLMDLIIPTDDTPGAREAGCAEFADFIISHDEEKKPLFRKGLKWLDAHAEKPFVELSKERQIKILESISSPAAEGHDFFMLAREYTVMGYYTSRVGMQALGVPTLKTYPSSPECPHHGDPEHKRAFRKLKA